VAAGRGLPSSLFTGACPFAMIDIGTPLSWMAWGTDGRSRYDRTP
jgi:hypothetical protein